MLFVLYRRGRGRFNLQHRILTYHPIFIFDLQQYQPTADIGLDLLNGVIVFLQCIFVVGLRSLGTKMIDPYGDDLEDLSVINYVEGTLEICSTIMNSKQPPKKSVIAKA